MRARLRPALENTALQSTRDRGSVSLWVVIFAFVTLALLILIVDGGQVIVAKSRAADIAEQAARASPSRPPAPPRTTSTRPRSGTAT